MVKFLGRFLLVGYPKKFIPLRQKSWRLSYSDATGCRRIFWKIWRLKNIIFSSKFSIKIAHKIFNSGPFWFFWSWRRIPHPRLTPWLRIMPLVLIKYENKVIFILNKSPTVYFVIQVKDIHLCAELFSVENDLLTPTLKSKRPQLKTHFKPQLDAMYEKLDWTARRRCVGGQRALMIRPKPPNPNHIRTTTDRHLDTNPSKSPTFPSPLPPNFFVLILFILIICCVWLLLRKGMTNLIKIKNDICMIIIRFLGFSS